MPYEAMLFSQGTQPLHDRMGKLGQPDVRKQVEASATSFLHILDDVPPVINVTHQVSVAIASHIH